MKNYIPILPNGNQESKTNVPFRDFDKNYVEENIFIFERYQQSYGARANDCVHLKTKDGHKRYMFVEDFMKMIEFMIDGRIQGKFKYKKIAGHSYVRAVYIGP